MPRRGDTKRRTWNSHRCCTSNLNPRLIEMRRISTFQWLLILTACALVIFLLTALSIYVGINEPEDVWENITELIPFWAFWVTHAPLVFILSRRFSFERPRLIKSLLVYLSVGTAWAMLMQGS